MYVIVCIYALIVILPPFDWIALYFKTCVCFIFTCLMRKELL